MDGKTLDIRPLAAIDTQAFKEIRLKATLDSPIAILPTFNEEAQRTHEENLARIQQTENQIVFGAFSDMQLIGIAGLRRESLLQVSHKATLWGVFVHPERRKEGIARQILAKLVSYARSANVLQINLCVNAENPRAQDLYRSLGFKSFGIEPRAVRVGERFFAEEHMVLRLDE